MTRALPPHIAWPLFVVLILLVGIGGAFSALVAAYSDGGAQVVDDYYTQAVLWNETAARRAEVAALGWRTELRVLTGAAAAPLRSIEITVRDGNGEPVEGLVGTIRATRPHKIGATAEIPLLPASERPGVYAQQIPIGAEGLWDFGITTRKGAVLYQTSIREEIRF